MTPRFLSVEAVKRIQADSIRTYGGSHGLREAGLLQSAVDRAENRYRYEPESSIGALGAALSWGLIKNHVFIDGNKRAGLGALIAFLDINGHELRCDVSEAQSMTLRAAASEITEAQWIKWVEETEQPVTR